MVKVITKRELTAIALKRSSQVYEPIRQFQSRGKRMKARIRRSNLTSRMSVACLLLFTNLLYVNAALGADSDRPNIVLIVADDLGFSDLGSFGGEINTPNLDMLAYEGLRFTNFYVSASCSPTRSMLLTGLDNHVVGLGNMHERTAPNQLGLSGYEGVLRDEFTTVADVFRSNGYNTYMTGKWHLGHAPNLIPAARGFDRSFSILNGAGSHFNDTGANIQNEKSEFTQDGEYLAKLPRGYYSSKTFTNKLIEFIDEDKSSDEPFFAYLAYQTPHDPLQVPNDWLRRYQETYDIGWDAIREQRLGRMKDMGIVSSNATNAPRLWYVPEWDDLTGIAQVQNARRMEVYASMVEYMDQEIGRLVSYLEDNDLLENTIIVFFSDNGPNPNDPIAQAQQGAGAILGANFFATDYRTAFESWGRKDGFVAQSAPWAQVSATPFAGFKLTSFEGGIRSPLIVWQDGHLRAGEIDNNAIIQVGDIAPTLLDIAGIADSSLFSLASDGMQVGQSRKQWIEGTADAVNAGSQGFGMEIFGGRAYREDQWKITWMHKPFGIDDWQLFDLDEDPAEQNDLSDQFPEIKTRLVSAWNEYAVANNVTLPDRTIFDDLEDNLPARPPVDAPDWPRGQERNWTSQ